MKSDKNKGIHVRIEIVKGIGKNDFHGLDNFFSEISNCKILESDHSKRPFITENVNLYPIIHFMFIEV